MRRILCVAIVSLATVFCSTELFAQVRWGITGGLGWSQSKVSEIVEEKAPAGWNAGLTVSFDLPLGFSLQPTLRYHHKDALLTSKVGQKMDFVEFPLALQWGPDLLIFRPFVEAAPYVSYALSNKTYSSVGGLDVTYEDKSWKDKQRFGYGLGLGGGIEVWRFQISARYNWDFGTLYDVAGWNDIKDHFDELNAESSSFGGVTLNLSFFF